MSNLKTGRDLTIGSFIEDFIPDYPELDDEDFFLKLARKKEIFELALDKDEELEPGTLQDSQLIMQRLFSGETPYSEISVFHKPGTGKTCVASAINEGIKARKVSVQKPALIFVKNKTLKDTFADSIHSVCTTDVYIPQATEAEEEKGIEISENIRQKRLRREVAKYYIINTYSYIHTLSRLSDEEITKRYSGRVVIIDEAHILSEKEGSGVGAEAKGTYEKFLRFMRLIKNCVKIVMTGTPFWDRPEEFAETHNLILSEEEALPTKKAFIKAFYNSEGELTDPEGILRASLRGRVSYLRSSTNIGFRRELGVTSPYTKYVPIFPVVMSPFQEKFSTIARTEIEEVSGGKGKGVRKVAGGTLGSLAVMSATAVFPEISPKGEIVPNTGVYRTSWGKKKPKNQKNLSSFDEIVQKTPKGYKVHPALKKEIKARSEMYSAKFDFIVKAVLAEPNKVFFIFCENVTGVGGAISLGIWMETHGLSWVRKASAIKRAPVERGGKSIRRFTVISSDPATLSSDAEIFQFLQEHNKPENSHGAYSQVIIGSEKIMVGNNIKHCTRVFVVSPHWNMSEDEQAVARAYRLGALDALPEEERDFNLYRLISVRGAAKRGEASLKSEGEDNEVASNKERWYSAFPGVSPAVNQKIGPGEGVPVMDLYVMSVAEKKINAPLNRMIKEEAPTCMSFYERNVLATDVDGTSICDFTDCNYQCDGIPEPDKSSRVWNYKKTIGELDYSTYNLLYAGDRVKELAEVITSAFHIRNHYSFTELSELAKVKSHEENLFLQALDTLINSRAAVPNRLGFLSFIKYSGDQIFLDPKVYSFSGDEEGYAQAEYTERMLVTKIKSLDEQISELEFPFDLELIQTLCEDPSSEKLQLLSLDTAIELFEYIYIRLRDNPKLANKPIVKAVMDEFADEYVELEDGRVVHFIRKIRVLGKTGYSVGRENLEEDGKSARLLTPRRITNPSGKRSSKKSAKGKTAKGKASPQKPSEKGFSLGEWTTVTSIPEEREFIEAYKIYRKEHREQILEGADVGFYGSVSKQDHMFRLFFKGPRKTGRVAETQPAPLLRKSLTELDYDPFETDEQWGDNFPPLVKNANTKEDINITKDTIKSFSDSEIKKRALLIIPNNLKISVDELKNKSVKELRVMLFFASISSRLLLSAFLMEILDRKGLLEGDIKDWVPKGKK